MENKYKEAIELLKDVLLQNDEKDELQLKIESFLIANGELKGKQPEIISMTKKEFKSLIDIHKYTGGGRENDITAVYFDWKTGGIADKWRGGYKYCVYARTSMATRDELINALYDVVTGKKEDVEEYYINLAAAPTDDFRFKVPLTASGLGGLLTQTKSYRELLALKELKQSQTA